MTEDEFSRLVSSQLAFLTNLGYSFIGVLKAETLALGGYLEAEYRNSATSRRVLVWYTPVGKASKATMCVFLEYGQDTFELGAYLQHIAAPQSRIEKLNIEVAEPLQINQVLAQAASVLQSELAEVVQGRKWQHVPIDWQGYK